MLANTHTHTHKHTHAGLASVSYLPAALSCIPCQILDAAWRHSGRASCEHVQDSIHACLSSLRARVNGNTFWNVPTTATNCLPIPPAIFLRSPSSHPLSLRQGSTKMQHPHPNQGSIERDDQCKLAWDHREIGESLDSTICSLNCGKSIPSKLFASESNTCSLQQKHVSGNDTA